MIDRIVVLVQIFCLFPFLACMYVYIYMRGGGGGGGF